MSKLSRTAPATARRAVPTLPAWMISHLAPAPADQSLRHPLQLELPLRPWADDPIEGETDGMLSIDL